DFPLTPETGVNSQIGFRTSAVKGMSIDLALFHNRIKDTLIRENDPDPFGDGIFINAADSEITGVDLGARIDSYAFFESNYNLFAEVALNYTDAEFSDGPLDGNQVPEIPKEAGSLTFGADHSAGWHLSATVSHLGAFYSDIQNTRDITADGEAGEVPSRTLWSARASYVLPTPTETTLWLQGRNLTDKLYITDVQDGIRPGAERTVVGGVTVRF
ncbi:MAG: TonB-dependent receptor, partial [Oleiphilaceae bacterium]|nr:TonB-dependent receptor [Oleiphilaceae bacterium]